jgi:hypothetical protein
VDDDLMIEPQDSAEPEAVEVSIWFVCSIERRRIFGENDGVIAQEHGRTHPVHIDDVPFSEFVDGRPNASVLGLAEYEFIRGLNEIFPDYDVLVWEARFGSPYGPTLSRCENLADR